ncbi:MAG: hypothetical protein DRI86_06400 [Bacteroidetes bacterium]|nr:MAG: hypothetical protein DRI86_06400 [Bacteroidota bacterium]
MKAKKQNNNLQVDRLNYELLRTYENPTVKTDGPKPQKERIIYVAISPNQEIVACAYFSGEISLFNFKTSELIVRFQAHEGRSHHIEFSKNGEIMLSTGDDGRVMMFDIKSYTLINKIVMPFYKNQLELTKIVFALIDDDLEYIYFGANNGCIYKCDKKRNYKPYMIVSPESDIYSDSYYITAGIFSPDNKYLVYSSGFSIKFLNLSTNKIEKLIGGAHQYINDVVFHPTNSNILISWLQNGTITYWDVELEEALCTIKASNQEGYSHISINNTGEYLASGNDYYYVNIWDVNTKHRLAKISNKFSMDGEIKGHTRRINSLIFIEDGSLLTASHDGTAKLWKLTKK